MKTKSILFSVSVLALILSGCEGSDTYRGTWKALNGEGAKSKIEFTADSLTITKDDGEELKWEYSQNSFQIQGGTSNYGIYLENGLRLKILFPLKNDTEKGAIADQNGQIVFTIGRSDYHTYEDIFGVGGGFEDSAQN